MVKTRQIRRSEGLEKLGRYVVNKHNSLVMFFNRLHFKERSFCFGTRYGNVKNINFLLVFSQPFIEAGLAG